MSTFVEQARLLPSSSVAFVELGNKDPASVSLFQPKANRDTDLHDIGDELKEGRHSFVKGLDLGHFDQAQCGSQPNLRLGMTTTGELRIFARCFYIPLLRFLVDLPFAGQDLAEQLKNRLSYCDCSRISSKPNGSMSDDS